jgi:predicted pyridoxine 5'-phosphate oxidase superfamily flavin-nucleotide-binding protein
MPDRAQSRAYVSDIAFSPAVKRVQERLGSRAQQARMESGRGWRSAITPDLAAFIAERDSFYLATASAEGQPYVQHRGGRKGFLKVLDSHRTAFADFAGNRQYLTLGNLSENPRVCLFLMDYANRRRIKVWGTAAVVEHDAALMRRLADPGYEARPERAIVISVEAWDVNCSQHIAPRYTEAEIAPAVAELVRRIEALEAENAALKAAR